MRWPWRRNTVQLIGGEVRGRTAASPLGVWARVEGKREDLIPRWKGFEDGTAVWVVTVTAFPEAMGADLIPPRTAIEWQFPNMKPWRHPDGKD